MHYLKQSTAATIVLGPFVDSTDGVTAETALTISQADVRLSKDAGAFAQAGEATSATHMENGYYSKPLNSTDTNTLGRLLVAVNESGAMPVWHEFTVLSAQVYDSLIGGTDLLDVSVTQLAGSSISQTGGLINANVTQVSGDSTAADNLELAFDDTAGPVPHLGIVDQGTLQSATSTTAVLRSALALADDIVIGCQLQIVSGTGAGQTRGVSDYVSSTDTATVDAAWITTPDSTSVYKLWAGAPAPTTAPAVNVTHFGGTAGTFASGRPEVNTSHVAGTAQTAGDIIADTNDIQARLPAALVSGRMDCSVGAMAANVITAAATAADFTTEVTSGLATAAGVSAVEADTQDIQSRLPAALTGGRMDSAVGAMANNVMTAAAAAADLTTELQSGLATAAALVTAQADLDDIQTRLPAALVSGRMDVSVGAFAANTGMAAIRTATAQAGAAGTVTLDASASSTDDLYNDHDVVIVSGTGSGQRRHIADYAGSTKIATIRPNWATAPDNTSTFVILSATSPWDHAMADHLDSGSAGSSLNAAGSAGDPWTTPLPGAYGAGTAGKIVGDNINATISSRASQTSLDTVDDLLDTEVADIRARLPAALVSGRMDCSVGAMAANVMTAAATAADYLDEVADAVHDEVVDGSTTHRQSVRLQNSALAGKASGLGSTAVAFRDIADTKDRITATVDSEGNRSAVTRDLS